MVKEQALSVDVVDAGTESFLDRLCDETDPVTQTIIVLAMMTRLIKFETPTHLGDP